MEKICIITHSHLCRNPRVVKEANALSRAGYNVTILTTWTNSSMLEEDQALIDTARINYLAGENLIPGKAGRWSRLYARLVRRFATELVRLSGYQTFHALGYSFRKNLNKAIALDADLYICHQELPLIIGCKLIMKGYKAAFDFEDWYSRDLLAEARKSRPLRLLEKYEKFALKFGALTYTTSEALAGALSRFASAKAPGVLYNAFPLEERQSLDGMMKDRKEASKVSLFWFSQTIGPGRGLEELAEALNKIQSPFELHLRGNCGQEYKRELLNRFDLKDGQEVIIHPLVSHNELLSRISEHDIGLALERSEPESRNLTITNKILQYLQGGLAVIASGTAGQTEVASKAEGSVFICRNEDPGDLTEMLTRLINDKELLERAKYNAIETATRHFNWEKEEAKLLGWMKNLKPAGL